MARPPLNIDVIDVTPVSVEEAREFVTHTDASIQELSDRHHAIARLLAAGTRPIDIAEVTGYTPARVYQLSIDPMMRAVIEHYREPHEAEMNILIERLTLVGKEALAKLLDKVENESLPAATLADIAVKALDRLGHSPVNKSVNVNVGVDVDADLRASLAAKERVRSAY